MEEAGGGGGGAEADAGLLVARTHRDLGIAKLRGGNEGRHQGLFGLV